MIVLNKSILKRSKPVDKTGGERLRATLDDRPKDFLKVDTPSNPSVLHRHPYNVSKENDSVPKEVRPLHPNSPENDEITLFSTPDAKKDIGQANEKSLISVEMPTINLIVDAPNETQTYLCPNDQRTEFLKSKAIETQQRSNALSYEHSFIADRKNHVSKSEHFPSISSEAIEQNPPTVIFRFDAPTDSLTALLKYEQQENSLQRETPVVPPRDLPKKIQPNDISLKDLNSNLPKFGPPSSYRSLRGGQLSRFQSMDTQKRMGNNTSNNNQEFSEASSSVLRRNFDRNRPSSFSVHDKQSDQSLMPNRLASRRPWNVFNSKYDIIDEVSNSSAGHPVQNGLLETGQHTENKNNGRAVILQQPTAVSCESSSAGETGSNCIIIQKKRSRYFNTLDHIEPTTLLNHDQQDSSIKTERPTIDHQRNLSPNDQMKNNEPNSISPKDADCDLQKFGPPSSYKPLRSSQLNRNQSMNTKEHIPNSLSNNHQEISEASSSLLRKSFDRNRPSSFSVFDKQYDRPLLSNRFPKPRSRDTPLSSDTISEAPTSPSNDGVRKCPPVQNVQTTEQTVNERRPEALQWLSTLGSERSLLSDTKDEPLNSGQAQFISFNTLKQDQSNDSPKSETPSVPVTLPSNYDQQYSDFKTEKPTTTLPKDQLKLSGSNDVGSNSERADLHSSYKPLTSNQLTKYQSMDTKNCSPNILTKNDQTPHVLLIKNFERSRPLSFSVSDKQLDVSNYNRSSYYRVRPTGLLNGNINSEAPSNHDIQNDQCRGSSTLPALSPDPTAYKGSSSSFSQSKSSFQPKYGPPSSYRKVLRKEQSETVGNAATFESKNHSNTPRENGEVNCPTKTESVISNFDNPFARTRPASFSTQSVKYDAQKYGRPSTYRYFRRDSEIKSPDINATCDKSKSLSANDQVDNTFSSHTQVTILESEDLAEMKSDVLLENDKSRDLPKFSRSSNYRVCRNGAIKGIHSVDSSNNRIHDLTENGQLVESSVLDEKSINDIKNEKQKSFTTRSVQYNRAEVDLDSGDNSVLNKDGRPKVHRTWSTPRMASNRLFEKDQKYTSKIGIIAPVLSSDLKVIIPSTLPNDLNNNCSDTNSLSTVSKFNRPDRQSSIVRSPLSKSAVAQDDSHMYSSRTSLQLTTPPSPEKADGGLVLKAADSIIGTVQRKISIFNYRDLVRTQSMFEKRAAFGTNRAQTVNQMEPEGFRQSLSGHR